MLLRTLVSAVLGILLALAHSGSALASGPDPSAQDQIVSRLRGRLSAGAGRQSAETALALRRLKDPELRPLFGMIAASDVPELRRQGLLGLAELESPPAINVPLMMKLKDPAERSSILGEALALGLVGPEQMKEMLGSPEIDPYVELVLRGRLHAAGENIDTARIDVLASSPSLTIRCVALLTKAQAGDATAGGLAADLLLAVARPERDRDTLLVLEHVRRERLAKATGFLARVHADYASDPLLQADVLRVWMEVDPRGAADAWRSGYPAAKDLAAQLRLALLALDHAGELPPELFELLVAPGAHPSIAAIGRAGQALARRSGVTEALVALAKAESPPASLWLAQRVSEVAGPSSVAAWKALIETAAGRASRREPIDEAVIVAAEKLALGGERGWLSLRLTAACDKRDEPMTHALLAGVLRAGGAPAWDPGSPPKWPDRLSAGLATLSEARADLAFGADPVRLERLQAVALGFTPIPEVFQSQAMWLALERGTEPRRAAGLLLAGGLPK